jgi:hypothetical protein
VLTGSAETNGTLTVGATGAGTRAAVTFAPTTGSLPTILDGTAAPGATGD